MTIKEIRFRPPLESPSRTKLALRVQFAKAKELDVGVHDVTPSGYRDKYEVDVTDPGDGDNIAEVNVTRRGGAAISTVYDDELEMKYSESKTVPLEPGSPPMVLARPNSLDNPGEEGFKVHGIIYYEPKS